MLHKKSQDKTSEQDKLTNDANSDDAVDEAVHYNKSNDDNDSAHNDNNNHRFFIPNSKYSTIVIYALLFVVGTIGLSCYYLFPIQIIVAIVYVIVIGRVVKLEEYLEIQHLFNTLILKHKKRHDW